MFSFVGEFKSKKELVDINGEQQKNLKNVFVKNLNAKTSNDKLQEEFKPHGKITSCVVMTNEKGKSKGFGFVAYEDGEHAELVLI